MKLFKDYSSWDWENMVYSYALGGGAAMLIILVYQTIGVMG